MLKVCESDGEVLKFFIEKDDLMWENDLGKFVECSLFVLNLDYFDVWNRLFMF